jgi:hypothetical protein
MTADASSTINGFCFCKIVVSLLTAIGANYGKQGHR